MSDDIQVTESSGNVFKDLGLPQPERELLKTALSFEIYTILKARRLTQARAAKRLGISQADVSRLKNADVSRFTVDRLLRFLKALDHEVEIHIRPRGGDSREDRVIRA